METLIQQLEAILEVENIDTSRKFEDFEEWDSLSVLAILALLDSDYKLNMTKKEIEVFPSIAAFIEYIEKNGK
jgi:acyl carrier protein